MTTDTPRTDAHTIQILPVDCGHYSCDYCPNGSGRFVEADRMRQLERELSAALADKAELVGVLHRYGRHDGSCAAMQLTGNNVPCDCGFSAALAQYGGKGE